MPKATSTQKKDYQPNFVLEQSNTIVLESADNQYFTFQVGCNVAAIDLEVRLEGNGNSWISANKRAESSSDLDCSDGSATLIFSSDTFEGIDGASEIIIRQVFPFGYSTEVSFVIVKTSTTPTLDFNIQPYLNTNYSKLLEVSGDCGFVGTQISALLIPALSYVPNGTDEELESAALVNKQLECETNGASGILDFTEISLGSYKIVVKYTDLSATISSPDVNDVEFISAPTTGLNWSVSGSTYTVIEGADFVNAPSALTVTAAHPDPSAEISYSVKSTTCNSAWSGTIAINDDGNLSGTPGGYPASGASAVEEACSVVVESSSRLESLTTSFTLSIENNYCSTGTLDTTCVYGSDVTLHDDLSLYGTGSVNVNSGVTVSIAAMEEIAINIGGDFQVDGSFNVNVYSLSANSLVVSSGGQINLEGLGNPTAGPGAGMNDGEGAAHAGKGGVADCAQPVADGGAGVAYGDFTDPQYGSAGNGPSSGVYGGPGGGRFVASLNTLSLDGLISVKGGLAGTGGGGSGGAIKITTDSFLGSGELNASGGDASLAGSFGYGGGSGGFISVTSQTTTFSGVVELLGGYGSVENFYSNSGANGFSGQAEFIVSDICDDGSVETTCMVESVKYLTESTIDLNNLVISSVGGIINPMNANTITINTNGFFELKSGATINSSLEVNSDSYIKILGNIDSDGKGHQGGGGCQVGFGPGAGQYDSGETSGAGHATLGNESNTNCFLPSLFGSIVNQSNEEFGSGGAGAGDKMAEYAAKGGAGGGKVFLISSADLIEVSGNISANGQDAFSKSGQNLNDLGASGGAGGFIKIDTPDEFKGGGILSVNGGSAGLDSGFDSSISFCNGGSGGSYGYIDISFDTNNFSGSQNKSSGSNGY